MSIHGDSLAGWTEPSGAPPDPGADGAIQPVMTALRQLPAVRVHTLERPVDGDEVSDAYAGFRVARLAASYHAEPAPVVWIWHRAAAGGPIELLAAGTTTLPPLTGASPLPAGELGRWLDVHGAWAPLVVRPESLLTEASPADSGPSRASSAQGRPGQRLEHGIGALGMPFTLLVVAGPVPGEAVEQATLALDTRALADGRQRDSRPGDEAAFQQWSWRVRELRSAQAQGAWVVRVVAGGPDRVTATAVAGAVASGFDLQPLGYALAPAGTTGQLTDALRDAAPEPYATDHQRDWQLPDPSAGIVASTVVAELVRPPAVELPGIRLVTGPSFDVTPEHDVHGGSGSASDGVAVRLGAVLDVHRRPAGDFTVTADSLNRHTLVAGATGSGKSQTVRTLLENATRARLPWLVVEPAKSEYRAMANRLAAADRPVVIRPGDPGEAPAGLNPLRPQPGFGLQTHLDLVRALFMAAFDAQEPFPQVLALALTRCYEEQGWDVATGMPIDERTTPRYPTLTDLQRSAEAVVDEIGYGREIRQNVTGFIRVRLASLCLGTTGRFLEGGHQLDLESLLRRNVIVEIEDVGDDHNRAFLMGMILLSLIEHLRVRAHEHPEQQNAGLRHLTVFEEAHRLLRAPEPGAGQSASGHAVRMIAGLLAEIRAYGEGLVVAEQIPSHLITDVVKNTSVKILHRLPAADDRETVGATMNLSDEQSRYVVTLPPGEAAVFADGFDQPLLIRLPDGTDRERGAASVDGPTPITGPESGRCQADYGLHGLPDGQRLAGQRLLRTCPGIVLWAELAVVACLTGHAIPVPSDRLRAELTGIEPILVDVALVSAVDDAVADRSRVIHKRVPPAQLAVFVSRELRTMWREPAYRHTAMAKWVIDGYRWQVVMSRLTSDTTEVNIAELERFVGESIPGADRHEQVRFALGRQASEAARADVRAILVGDAHLTPFEHAVGSRAEHANWKTAVSAAVSTWLEPADWIVPTFVDERIQRVVDRDQDGEDADE